MSQSAEIIDINELSQIIGKTATAIRNDLARQTGAVPPPMQKTSDRARWRWKRSTVDQWIEDQPEMNLTPQPKRGRPRGS